MSTLRAHMIVSGRVQGVGFRFTTQLKAEEFGVKGWVRNRSDGAVEIVAEGDVEKVYQFIDTIKANPSPAAHIKNVELSISEELENYKSFRTLY
ncbi:acylphosphatase [Amphibacillus sp. Q70]|uniref:acylphosphatase n=1 Tax=Amphibacillus sp. Q70 TaxID=3453416 RepID=UPI003F83140B